jgi:hypothetical protein
LLNVDSLLIASRTTFHNSAWLPRLAEVSSIEPIPAAS